jgi:hypothetical protein
MSDDYMDLAVLLDGKRVSGGAVILSQDQAKRIQLALEHAHGEAELNAVAAMAPCQRCSGKGFVGGNPYPCSHCGGWTQNADGHRDDCPSRAKAERSSDALMLLVWAQWAKNEGNEAAAAVFRRAADALPPRSA